MQKFDMGEYAAFLVKGKLHEALEYIESFPEKQEEAAKYHAIFKENNTLKRSTNAVVNQLDQIYQAYYKNVFWHHENVDQANTRLFEDLHNFCKVEKLEVSPADIENKAKEIVEGEGYHYLGGKTAGYYGPYIWETSNVIEYHVDLPHGKEDYGVVMMEGFVSRSWLDFISLGKVGTGGWIGDDGRLWCVASTYDTESPNFKISFLKHEAQHGNDKRNYPNITSRELEYRAKLVELIYWEDEKIIKMLFLEADDNNENNAHAMASHLIISHLSEKLFNKAFEENLDKWIRHLDQVKALAKELLLEDTKRLDHVHR